MAIRHDTTAFVDTGSTELLADWPDATDFESGPDGCIRHQRRWIAFLLSALVVLFVGALLVLLKLHSYPQLMAAPQIVYGSRTSWASFFALETDPKGNFAESYHCDADSERWATSWSDSKKVWCCAHEQKGCPLHVPSHYSRPSGTAALRQGSTEANTLPYHCDVEASSWQAAWSDAKKRWCCSQQPALFCRSLTNPDLPAGTTQPAVAHTANTAASLPRSKRPVVHQTWDVPKANAAQELARHATKYSLFCWAIMLPHGPELELMKSAAGKGIGLFECDAWAVYSNVSLVLPNFQTQIIHESLEADRGGKYNTWLNTDIFRRAWKRVVADGVWREHG